MNINWVKNKKRLEREELNRIELEIAQLNNSELTGYRSCTTKEYLIALENNKTKLLRQKEEDWRLKSRAIWLQIGDENTKFFQQHANGRRTANSIWELTDQHGFVARTQSQLHDLGTQYFTNLDRAPLHVDLPDILHIAQSFNRYVEPEQEEELNAPVTRGELEGVLKWFKRDKSPGPNGWPIEFFIHFFELMANDLLIMIEDSRVRGQIYDGFNSTFIALITKSDHPSGFQDYRPISLCNCIYKIISKIIANQIKPFLSDHIAKEQFDFLHHR